MRAIRKTKGDFLWVMNVPSDHARQKWKPRRTGMGKGVAKKEHN